MFISPGRTSRCIVLILGMLRPVVDDLRTAKKGEIVEMNGSHRGKGCFCVLEGSGGLDDLIVAESGLSQGLLKLIHSKDLDNKGDPDIATVVLSKKANLLWFQNVGGAF